MDVPLSTAHLHSSKADDALAKGLLIQAADEHFNAAEAFKACVDQATDEGNKRTMRMLHEQHIKSGKELQRRIAKLQEEKKDPSLPQPYLVHNDLGPARTSSSVPQRSATSPSPLQTQQAPRRMTDSQHTVDESFMVLGGQKSDPGDAFNQFWKIMEGMLDNLSQPVAFATIPLAFDVPTRSSTTVAREGSLSSDTDAEEPSTTRRIRNYGITTSLGENLVDFADDSDAEVLVEDPDNLSESFCLIPSGSNAISPLSQMRKENAALKAEIEAMQQRLLQTERVLQMRKEREEQLKDSIVLARQQAHRAMAASMAPGQRQGGGQQATIDFGALTANMNVVAPPPPPPPPPPSRDRDRETRLGRRVRELEDELRVVKAENEQQKAMISKFRERWEKVKESAKRKKEAKAQALAFAVSPVGGTATISEAVRETTEDVLEPGGEGLVPSQFS